LRCQYVGHLLTVDIVSPDLSIRLGSVSDTDNIWLHQLNHFSDINVFVSVSCMVFVSVSMSFIDTDQ